MFSNTQTKRNKLTNISNQLEALNNITNENDYYFNYDNNIINNNSKDKFSILNNKISSISENKNTKNFKNLMEQKINEVKENFKTNIDSLEQKYNILNSQMEKFTKIIEEDKVNKEKNKIKNEFEFKELEQDIKKMLSKQREYMKSYIDDYTKRIDNILINHSEEIKEENYVVKENINNLKNYMVNEINNVNNKIIEENEDKIMNIKYISDDIEQKFEEIKENIDEQKQKRENVERIMKII